MAGTTPTADAARPTPNAAPPTPDAAPPTPAFPPGQQAVLDARGRLPLTTPNVQGVDGAPAAPPATKIDALLTPTEDKPGDKYVHFGKLQVERGLVDDFKEAQKYLAKSPEGVNALHALENGKQTVTVHKITDGNDLFNSEKNQINWDPKSAMVNADGSRQSAAVGLLHEQGHAVEFANNPARFNKQVRESNQRYDTAEEQRNIEGLETRALKDLPGEGGRKDHGGIPFEAKGPTSLEPASQTIVPPGQFKNALAGERFALAAHGYTAPPAPGAEADSVAKWDGKAHSGPIVHLDANTVAQSVGRGQYQVYDVQKDLHGVVPPENVPGVSIDTKGQVAQREPQALGKGGP
jgi:hypothetical protein